MWRLWDTNLQEEQQWDSNNEANDGIPMLASDSDESVIFVAERPLPSVQYPHIVARAANHTCLPFQVQPVTLLHTLMSIDQVFYFILINIFYSKHFPLFHMDKKLIIWYILFVVFFGRKPSQYYCGNFQLSGGWPNRWREIWLKEFWRKLLNLCELYTVCLI